MKKEDDSTKRQELYTLKTSSFFEEEALPEVTKDIDELLKALDKKLAKSRKIIEENDRIILERMSYTALLTRILY